MGQTKGKGIELYRLESPCYLEGSPVIVSRGSLLIDRFSEEAKILLTLKSISDLRIVGCEVRITLYDAKGLPYEDPLFYKYDGLSVARGKEFGGKNIISLPDNLVRSFEIMVSEVTFGDFTRWENRTAFQPIDPMESLKVAFDSEEMARQYALRYGNDCEYLPNETADIWYCTCGAVNHISESRCYNCRRNRTALRDVNVRALKKDSEARAKSEKVAEEAEQRRKEKINRRSNVILKVCLIVLPILLVIGLILATVPPFMERRENYANAERLLQDGKFDEAAVAFKLLGTYSDSELRASKDVPYEKALYVLQCAENSDPAAFSLLGITAENAGSDVISMVLYQKALDMFTVLDGYKESGEKISEINTAIEDYHEQERLNAYNNACSLLEQKAYLAAHEAFRSMSGYKDADELAQESLYRRASGIVNFCKGNNIRHIFLNISGKSSQNTVISLPGSVLAELGSDVINELKSIFSSDGVDIFFEDEPGTSEGSEGVELLPICQAAAAELKTLGEYKDSEELEKQAETAGDYTAEFYALLKNGDLDQAAAWLSKYDDEIPERSLVPGWVEMYAPFRRYWKLDGGDSTVIPYSVGLTDGQRLNEFSSKVCINDGTATLVIEQPDGDYTVQLTCEVGTTDFGFCPDEQNYYYGRINQVDHFIYMRYLSNGKMLTSCEYFG